PEPPAVPDGCAVLQRGGGPDARREEMRLRPGGAGRGRAPRGVPRRGLCGHRRRLGSGGVAPEGPRVADAPGVAAPSALDAAVPVGALCLPRSSVVVYRLR